jgi:microcystin-dependent protein
MSDPFLGEIRVFGFDFPPRGWANCAGQLLPISQNTALFSILGTSFGGDGRTTFALPNLQGTVRVHVGAGPGLTPRALGESGGTPEVTLSVAEMPAHSHAANCNSGLGTSYGPANNVWASDAGGASEYASAANIGMAPNALTPAGGGQPHDNRQPYLALNFCIALQGIYPPRA